jgi:hypothetical protein
MAAVAQTAPSSKQPNNMTSNLKMELDYRRELRKFDRFILRSLALLGIVVMVLVGFTLMADLSVIFTTI